MEGGRSEAGGDGARAEQGDGRLTWDWATTCSLGSRAEVGSHGARQRRGRAPPAWWKEDAARRAVTALARSRSTVVWREAGRWRARVELGRGRLALKRTLGENSAYATLSPSSPLSLSSRLGSLRQQLATRSPNQSLPARASLVLHPDMGSCPSLKNILVLDSEGKRVAVKYYSDEWPSLSSKLDFEKAVFMKIRKTGPKKEEEAEVVMFDGHIIVYKFIQAVACVLPSKKLNKKTALENLDLIFLCLDEVTDEG
ncbi:hypothetical protein PR202_ga09104 [Eleusine coracana subsp. coracana]|uniref:Coatomer subunit zeta n=1 Tax=Eleusine coracana subsp. coracana TaxID=191504 RepID=A0AAV5C4C8_ELECO|nr:hypothetical protein PR202_ga09104 [Eleusine coracana subsp. coracana]